MKLPALTLVVAALLSTACSPVPERETPDPVSTGDPQPAAADIPSTGHVLFEAYSLNPTWDRAIRGFFIDRTGRVWKYACADEDWTTRHEAEGLFSRADLDQKHRNPELSMQLDPEDLKRMKELISEAALGPVETPPAETFDRGVRRYLAYSYDPYHHQYREVLLGTHGDFEDTNLTGAARKLMGWLEEIEEQVQSVEKPPEM